MTPEKRKELVDAIARAIDRSSVERDLGNTPDFMLADVAVGAMEAFAAITVRRDEWYGRPSAQPGRSEE